MKTPSKAGGWTIAAPLIARVAPGGLAQSADGRVVAEERELLVLREPRGVEQRAVARARAPQNSAQLSCPICQNVFEGLDRCQLYRHGLL